MAGFPNNLTTTTPRRPHCTVGHDPHYPHARPWTLEETLRAEALRARTVDTGIMRRKRHVERDRRRRGVTHGSALGRGGGHVAGGSGGGKGSSQGDRGSLFGSMDKIRMGILVAAK